MSYRQKVFLKDEFAKFRTTYESRNPLNPKVTVEGHPAGARAWFVATKS